MTPYYQDSSVTLHHGDSLELMREMEPVGVHSIVTDPPYGLGFMGKDWDHGVPGVPFWKEALRVAKPGAFLLAFGGTRTFHRLACAIEDAGWEIRDTIMWVYGSGFPKSHDVSKAIDKEAGAERVDLGPNPNQAGRTFDKRGGNLMTPVKVADCGDHSRLTAPATDTARQWQGWGTALKPAWEPIIVARKPLEGTVAENVLKWGAGGMNIDGCRVATNEKLSIGSNNHIGNAVNFGMKDNKDAQQQSPLGRWPANLIHDGSQEVLELFPSAKSGGVVKGHEPSRTGDNGIYGKWGRVANKPFIDSGSAARFFYCAKASRAERGQENNHPTVKPLALMRYLCKLVTPPNGIILDPFMGSGSTGKAATEEGFEFIGCDKEIESVEIAAKRMSQEVFDFGKVNPCTTP